MAIERTPNARGPSMAARMRVKTAPKALSPQFALYAHLIALGNDRWDGGTGRFSVEVGIRSPFRDSDERIGQPGADNVGCEAPYSFSARPKYVTDSFDAHAGVAEPFFDHAVR